MIFSVVGNNRWYSNVIIYDCSRRRRINLQRGSHLIENKIYRSINLMMLNENQSLKSLRNWTVDFHMVALSSYDTTTDRNNICMSYLFKKIFWTKYFIDKIIYSPVMGQQGTITGILLMIDLNVQICLLTWNITV